MIKLQFSDIWNASLNTVDREPVQRDYTWASEMGKPIIDRYLSMKAVPPTNSPNTRSRRKFYAGNVWEFVAGLVLYQLGVIIPQQQEVWVDDTPIRVKGKLDYLIGGIPNYDFARDQIKAFPFQKEMTDRFMKTIDLFEERIGGKELHPLVYEIKSCSQYVIDMIGEGGNIIGHDLQIYHYLRGLKMDEGHICYISKDDALLEERVIKNPDLDLKQKYESDLITLKKYLDADEMPPKEPLILFENGRLKKSFGIEYSSYLTMIYGYKEPKEYSDAITGKISAWNRVLKRLADGAKITDKNKVRIEEMEKEGYNPYALAKVAKIEEEEIVVD